MRNPSHTRPVSLTVRIGNRPVELPWSSSDLAGVPNQEIEAWLDRQNLSAPELGALASVLGRLSCPSDLTPLGDPHLGRVTKAAKKRLPVSILRQLKQIQAKRKKLAAERNAKKQAAVAAKAIPTPVPAPASSVPDTSLPAVTAALAPAPAPEPIKAETNLPATEPVVEPLISPEDKALPVAPSVTSAVAPAALPTVIPLAPPDTSPVASVASPGPAIPPPAVLMPQPQVMVQMPSVVAPIAPSLSPLPVSTPVNPPVMISPSVYPVPAAPSYPTAYPAAHPPRPNTPLPTEYSYGFDTENAEDGEDWDEGYEEVGATEPAPAPKSAIGELVAGIGLIGALAWFALRKA